MESEVEPVSADAETVGRRVREARLAAGLTQRELAVGIASAAYISRIEAGNRRAGEDLLSRLAERLGTSVQSLANGAEAGPDAEIERSLDYAELALKNGEPGEALASVEDLRATADLAPNAAADLRARLLTASALEVQGDNRAAIPELERLVVDVPRDLHWIGIVMALSRCHRILGEFDRAIEVGTAAAGEIDRLGLSDTEEAIRLTVTVAGAHIERGDLHQALRMCEQAAMDAEEIGSDLALGSAYWNASLVRVFQGDANEAVRLGQQALTAFETCADARSRALLRGQVADMQLQLAPPDIDAAESNLRLAREVIDWSDASRISRERLRLVSARLLMAKGLHEEALPEAAGCLANVVDTAPTLAAEACIVLGRIALLDGRRSDALDHFQQGVLTLSACGADRLVAQSWFELAGLLHASGDDSAALDAYRRAGAANGLTVQTPVLLRI